MSSGKPRAIKGANGIYGGCVLLDDPSKFRPISNPLWLSTTPEASKGLNSVLSILLKVRPHELPNARFLSEILGKHIETIYKWLQEGVSNGTLIKYALVCSNTRRFQGFAYRPGNYPAPFHGKIPNVKFKKKVVRDRFINLYMSVLNSCMSENSLNPDLSINDASEIGVTGGNGRFSKANSEPKTQEICLPTVLETCQNVDFRCSNEVPEIGKKADFLILGDVIPHSPPGWGKIEGVPIKTREKKKFYSLRSKRKVGTQNFHLSSPLGQDKTSTPPQPPSNSPSLRPGARSVDGHQPLPQPGIGGDKRNPKTKSPAKRKKKGSDKQPDSLALPHQMPQDAPEEPGRVYTAEQAPKQSEALSEAPSSQSLPHSGLQDSLLTPKRVNTADKPKGAPQTKPGTTSLPSARGVENDFTVTKEQAVVLCQTELSDVVRRLFSLCDKPKLTPAAARKIVYRVKTKGTLTAQVLALLELVHNEGCMTTLSLDKLLNNFMSILSSNSCSSFLAYYAQEVVKKHIFMFPKIRERAGVSPRLRDIDSCRYLAKSNLTDEMVRDYMTNPDKHRFYDPVTFAWAMYEAGQVARVRPYIPPIKPRLRSLDPASWLWFFQNHFWDETLLEVYGDFLDDECTFWSKQNRIANEDFGKLGLTLKQAKELLNGASYVSLDSVEKILLPVIN